MHMLQASLPGAQRLLAAARQAGLMVVHTLEAHKPDLSGEGAISVLLSVCCFQCVAINAA